MQGERQPCIYVLVSQRYGAVYIDVTSDFIRSPL